MSKTINRNVPHYVIVGRTSPACIHCDLMKGKFREWGIPYAFDDINSEEGKTRWIGYFKNNGLKEVPVVFKVIPGSEKDSIIHINKDINTNDFTLNDLLILNGGKWRKNDNG